MKKWIKLFIPLILGLLLGYGAYSYYFEFIAWDNMTYVYLNGALIMLSFAGICAFTGKSKKSIVSKFLFGLLGSSAILFGLSIVVNNIIFKCNEPELSISIILSLIIIAVAVILSVYYIKNIKNFQKVLCIVLNVITVFSGVIGIYSLWKDKITETFYSITEALNPDGVSTADFYIDATKTGDIIPNIASVSNTWAMSGNSNLVKNEKYDIYEFVDYVQFMQCSGGDESRDLFKDPLDRTTMIDYDFTKLIESCRGLVKNNIKPWLKFGNVPLKYTKNSTAGVFSGNVYPPDDYNVYYDYIKAITEALVEEFGLDEVKSWRFGCMTEFENSDWFQAQNGSPEDSAVEFCKLYDYTAKALVDVLGDDIFYGTHAMVNSVGLWDEAIFLEHAAKGKNYATGETGSHIDYFAISFYDSKPGEYFYENPNQFVENINYVKSSAEKFGLTDLIYGVDEGRILEGNIAGVDSAALISRTVGYTWQAAYDARIFKQAINNGLDYFSSWEYLSGGVTNGYPTVSYHVLSNLSKFENSKSLMIGVSNFKPRYSVEMDCLGAWNEQNQTLRIMAYNFKNDQNYSYSAEMNFVVNVPQFDKKTVTVTKYLISDDCNYFDEWLADKEKYNITDDNFSWSPDAASAVTVIDNEKFKDILNAEELHKKYEECSKLVPVAETYTVEDGKIEFSTTLGASNVVFYEIAES